MDTLDALLGSNQVFAAGLAERHLDVEPQRQPAIVTCMDSRLDVFESFQDVKADVRQSILRVRRSPFLPHRDVVRGSVYEVDSHQLREVEADE